METGSIQLDKIEAKVMDGLKDFQQETVNRIASLYERGQKRVLVSDEVGLGKTLIARGTIAKFAKIAKDSGKDRMKVVYICSNAAIADQNLAKLCITEDVKREGVGNSRLSVQHLNTFWQEIEAKQEKQFIQLIPLTPDTSFRMTTGSGVLWERAVLFAILIHVPELKRYREPLEIIMQGDGGKGWNDWAKEYGIRDVTECNEATNGEYLSYMLDKVSEGLKKEDSEGNTLLGDIIEKCKEIKRSGGRKDVKIYGIIGRLRYLFAGISLEKLEPDLVILDEFQRFKYLLQSEEDSETGMLARKFFNSQTVCMLLLSATPYKMYSTLEEIDESLIDEHFSEFLNVMQFLNVSEVKQEQFKNVWNNYSIQLKEFSQGDVSILQAKNAAEDAMYQSVCRTERISAKENADMIDIVDRDRWLDVEEQDIVSYMKASSLIEQIGASYHVPIDYIKSCPYIMSFMKEYKLKKDIVSYFSNHLERINGIDKGSKDTLWLKRADIDKFKPMKSNNARLERVKEHVFQNKAELLLWVPASKPYYAPSGVFKGAEHFSKTLIFSSWEMVPRMVSSMLSYEEERRTVGVLARNNESIEAHYFNSERKPYPSPRLRFAVTDGRLNNMSLFCLLYPSKFLTDCYHPIECMNKGMTLKEIEKEIRERIAEKLDKIKSPVNGAIDQRWYYMAPLFLDPPGYATGWFNEDDNLLSESDEEKERDTISPFLKHLQNLRKIYNDNGNGKAIGLGRKPDDLYSVLTDMAIASPAICANRLYQFYSHGAYYPSFQPSQLAKRFIDMMNKTDSTAIVELACGKKSEDAHWKNVITYCKHGNFQSMLDEYAHLLVNGYDAGDTVSKLHKDILGTMNMRTTPYEFDTWQNFSNTVKGQKAVPSRIRTHFAVAFTKGDGNDKDTNRKKVVRGAFNSPFRPFVLTSTSIGQEGLDFHNYCRRIVHWNLPSNPIDLEQREGRINRFECLAIRQNVATRYGSIPFKSNVWDELFQEAARNEKTDTSSDLIPYWGLRETEDMIRIERIVPMYPFSRDQAAYDRLIKILSLYRLTLGQARQEELLEYLIQNDQKQEDLTNLFLNLSPYFKKHNGNAGGE
ncbi:MAG: helicase [Bacteroidales bacterium]|nr:helicase [Bacteroidales bacterium]